MTEAPDLIEEIVGWRAWGVKMRDPRTPVLCSVSHEAMWPADRWMVAECTKSHTPPGDANRPCTCGIYAARDRTQLDGLGYASGFLLKVIGEVGLAGRVVVGSQGWRAERARVIRLFVPYEKWEFVGLLRATYHVPVELANTLGPEEVWR